MGTKRGTVAACATTLAIAAAVALAGCGSSSTTAASSGAATAAKSGESASTAAASTAASIAASSAAATKEASSKYVVTIDSAELGEDYKGNRCIIITYTYTFTNNDSEAKAFLSSTVTEVYQDGKQCQTAVVSSIDSSGGMTKLKSGASTQVKVAYDLSSTSEVEVNVYELSYKKPQLAQRKFSVA